MTAPKIEFILFRRRNGQFRLAACRGDKNGCVAMRRDPKPKKPCPFCLLCEDENETLESVLQRIELGEP